MFTRITYITYLEDFWMKSSSIYSSTSECGSIVDDDLISEYESECFVS